MRQGVVLPETPRQRRDREGLEQDLIDLPAAGRPLRVRYRNFKSDPGAYLVSIGGPLPYMTRLREIAARTAEHERRLGEAYAAVEPTAWLEYVGRRIDFGEVNDLIDRHNRWYPIEARLPMDPKTGDYVLVNGQHYAKRPLDAHWVLERFPSRTS
jgi:hypothetical protein